MAECADVRLGSFALALSPQVENQILDQILFPLAIPVYTLSTRPMPYDTLAFLLDRANIEDVIRKIVNATCVWRVDV
jgi:hypothetical protein